MSHTNELRHHLVAFIDVLGQRNILREIRSLPTNAAEKERVGQALRETVGFIRVVRDSIRAYVKNFQVPTGIGLEGLDEASRKQFLEIRRSDIVVRGTSDTLVISVAIRPDNYFCNSVVGMFGALTGVSAMCLSVLAAGKVFRGGVDVGLGMDVEEGEIYGAALVRAYDLESRIASTPRVVVGTECLRFMDSLAGLPDSQPAARVAKDIGGLCRKLIVSDVDGVPIVDFVGEIIRIHAATPSPEIEEGLVKGYEFVVDEETRRRRDCDQSIHLKYLTLRKYLESRLPAWEIPLRT